MNYIVEYKELPYVGSESGRFVSLKCDSWEQACKYFNLAIKEIYDPDCGVSIKTEQGITKKSTNLLVGDCFNLDGSFKAGYNPTKPATTIDQQNIANALFDKDGDAKLSIKDVEAFLAFNPCQVKSDIGCYYYSMRIEKVTKGNYNSLILWR